MEKTILELAKEKRSEELKQWKVEKVAKLLSKKEDYYKTIEEVDEQINEIEKINKIPEEGCTVYNGLIHSITIG